MEKINIEELKEIMHDEEKLREMSNVVEVKEYVPIREKIAMIDGLIDIIVKENEYGVLVYNSIDLQVLMSVACVSLYSNIEISGDDYENYDILCQTGLLSEIENEEAQYDIDEFYKMTVKRVQDKIQENSLNHIMAKKADDALIIFERTMRNLDKMIDKGDPNIISKHLSKGVEAIAKKLPDFSAIDITKKFKGK